jgi:RND family efflux transporter MFP subunit
MEPFRKPVSVILLALALLAGCAKKDPSSQHGPQAMPVKTLTVALKPVPRSDEYVSTIKSRRSANIQPQVDGTLIRILVKSGDHVRAGQGLMVIDPLKQAATVEQQRALEAQKKAVYDYAATELERQRSLYQTGVTSKQAYDQAVQSYNNSKADWEAAIAARIAEQHQLAYYNLTAPFDGIVGDIPVHIGDYVSSSTVLTTVDENAQLEAYIYIPTERASDIRSGLPVQIVSSTGALIETTHIYFVSPTVDNSLQGILVKTPIKSSLDVFRNEQLVKARVIWSTAPAPTVPVLSITRIGGQAFVYVAEQTDKGTFARQRAVSLGDTVGNDYAVTSGLKPGDKVIISGTQFLQDGVPVQPLG